MSSQPPTPDRSSQLVAELRELMSLTAETREDFLRQLVRGYESAPQELRSKIRIAFLQQLVKLPEPLLDPEVGQFLKEKIEPGDMEFVELGTPDQVMDFCELLYGQPYEYEHEAQAERVRENVTALIIQTLRRFESSGEFEEMLRLLQLSPVSITQTDIGLRRMRNRVYIYEMRRVQRNRRVLYLYLALQIVLVLFIFPILFINVENGLIQSQLEQITEVPAEIEPRQFLTYADGLYWALITAASIGYGDLTPQTALGKSLAALLGVMGVITIGVIAGLILEWISPRTID